jgi:hypothetical protein
LHIFLATKLDKLVMGERDPFSFLLHDLVHAYKMFDNDYLLKGQLGFYKALLKLFSEETCSDPKFISDFDFLLKNDQKFSEEFDYLISDMNSHPRHLFYYFKAILIIAVKRKHDLKESGSRLSGTSLKEFEQLFETVLERFEMNEIEKNLSRKLIVNNQEQSSEVKFTKPSNAVDFTLLDNFFLNLA